MVNYRNCCCQNKQPCHTPDVHDSAHKWVCVLHTLTLPNSPLYTQLYSSLCPFRFRLHFEKESREEVERRKKLAREKVLDQMLDKDLEVDINDIYPTEKGQSSLTLSLTTIS